MLATWNAAHVSSDPVSAIVAVATDAQKLVELTYISGNAGTTATFQVASIVIVKP